MSSDAHFHNFTSFPCTKAKTEGGLEIKHQLVQKTQTLLSLLLLLL